MPADERVYQLLQQARSETRNGSARAAALLVDQAEALLNRVNDSGLEAAIHLERARIAWGLVRYTEGLQHIRRVLSLSDEAPLLRAEALSLQALLQNAQGNYSKALEGWILCLEEAGTSGNPELYIEAYLGIGHYYLYDNQPARAQLYHRYAFHLAEQHSDPQLRLKSALFLLFDLVQSGQAEEGLHVLAVARENIDAVHTDPAWQAEIHHYAAAIHLELGHIGEAEAALQSSLQINMREMLLWGETQNRMLLAKLYQAQGKITQAGTTLETAIAIASSFDQGYLLQQICLQLVALREAAGDFAAALSAHESYHRFAVGHRRQLKRNQRQLTPARMAQLELRLQLLKARYDLALLQQAGVQKPGEQTEDPLTGLLRRSALESLLQQWQHSGHSDRITLLLWQLHGLPVFNELYGSTAGDRLIQRCASLVQEAARQFHGAAIRFNGSGLLLIVDRAVSGAACRHLQEWIPQLRWEYENAFLSHSLTPVDWIAEDKPGPQIIAASPQWRWPATGNEVIA